VQPQYREANEEVALPLDSPHVHTLCTLEPFLSLFKVVVTPVVAYLDDVSVLEALRAEPSEVARIFDHPLEALLDPELAREEGLVPIGSEDWPYEEELHVRLYDLSHLIPVPRPHVSPVRSLAVMIYFVAFGPRLESCLPSDDNDMNQNFTDSPWLGNIYRLHRFRSTASPVKGLTADILVCPPHLIFFSSPFVPISPVDELRESLRQRR
jgi:hypothetical protein